LAQSAVVFPVSKSGLVIIKTSLKKFRPCGNYCNLNLVLQ
jgi:hypothetical protein